MYNRYIPQPDGSYRRNFVPDASPPPPRQEPQRRRPDPQEQCTLQEKCTPQEDRQPMPAPSPPSKRHPTSQRYRCNNPSPRHEVPEFAPPPSVPPCMQSGNVSSFLKNLLPKDFDTGDFFVLLLLLLMAGDCEEDKNTALLTLVLYLFL